MADVFSFAPVLGQDPPPKVLVLGSAPSVMSLAAGGYYANPQNAFWKIMGGLFGFDFLSPYEARVAHLKQQGVALWDVYGACEREGSADSTIKNATLNDLDGLLKQVPVQAVWLNGKKALAGFMKRPVGATPRANPIGATPRGSAGKRAPAIALPSTSPAYAAMSYEEKYKKWEAAWKKVF